MKKAVDAGIKVAVFDTAVNGEIPGVTVTQQDDASLTHLSFGQLVKDFNGKSQYYQAVGRRFPADGAPPGGLSANAEGQSGD
ncbi:Uncharacterised protein [Citrobacter koseri]|uniref:Uncharacterized protein n=1 Tax=Citrobacter koseri TaxID=545 RepID=A0A2X2WW29_CITKO|nr:Uncharacterised protein [Citrobacter koseri]